MYLAAPTYAPPTSTARIVMVIVVFCSSLCFHYPFYQIVATSVSAVIVVVVTMIIIIIHIHYVYHHHLSLPYQFCCYDHHHHHGYPVVVIITVVVVVVVVVDVVITSDSLCWGCYSLYGHCFSVCGVRVCICVTLFLY